MPPLEHTHNIKNKELQLRGTNTHISNNITRSIEINYHSRYSEEGNVVKPFSACASGAFLSVLFESDHSGQTSGFQAVFYLNGKNIKIAN